MKGAVCHHLDPAPDPPGQGQGHCRAHGHFVTAPASRAHGASHAASLALGQGLVLAGGGGHAPLAEDLAALVLDLPLGQGLDLDQGQPCLNQLKGESKCFQHLHTCTDQADKKNLAFLKVSVTGTASISSVKVIGMC